MLITDSVDTGSKNRRATRPSRLRKKADAIIYSIDYQGSCGIRRWFRNHQSLAAGREKAKCARWLRETGGQVFHVDRSHSLDDIFREFQDEIQSRSTPSPIKPPNPKRDGSYHKIDIKLTNKDYKAAAPQGLLRDRAGELASPDAACPPHADP